jgi:hypothetical protein
VAQAVRQPYPLQGRGGPHPALRPRNAPVQQASRHVVQRGLALDEEKPLKDNAQPVRTEPGQPPVGQPADVAPGDSDAAARGPVQRRHQVQ